MPSFRRLVALLRGSSRSIGLGLMSIGSIWPSFDPVEHAAGKLRDRQVLYGRCRRDGVRRYLALRRRRELRVRAHEHLGCSIIGPQAQHGLAPNTVRLIKNSLQSASWQLYDGRERGTNQGSVGLWGPAE